MSDVNQHPRGQMLIYSGRLDPQWTMSNDDWDELNQLVETLPGNIEHHGIFAEPTSVGYRGFVGYWKGERIYYLDQVHQAVKVKSNSFIVYYDHSKLVEMWFIKNAKKNADLDLQMPDS